MLLRRDRHGLLAIGQASHAWLSGQLARAWGNERFGEVAPREEVCLAACQHDTGMAAWDLEPARDPDSGLPRDFMHMDLDVHLELWRQGPRRLVRQCRYAALLVSMHGARLYEWRLRQRPDRGEPPDSARERASPGASEGGSAHINADTAKIRAFIADQRVLQRRLLETLRADPATAAHASPERVARNSDLIWTWDYLSLALCLGWPPRPAEAVPTAGAPVDLHLRGAGDGRVLLDPWPFAAPELTVRCEGQRLAESYASENALRAALETAPWETLELRLAPAAARSA
jgi:hypothetical protein